MSRFLFAVLLCLALVSQAMAQSNPTPLHGTVADASGALIPGATITVLDVSGEVLKIATTGSAGQFSITGLAPGKYVIQIEADHFQTANVNVEIGESAPIAPLDVILKLRGVLQQVNVKGQADSLTVPPASIAKAQLETLPGNVSQIPAEDYRSGAVLSMDDALSLTPGVFAEPKEGTEEVRLSIRGSGMNVPYGIRGVELLRDGIPQSMADGYSNSEQLDPFNADYVDVYRGADGLEYGAATLGGAINFVSPTGRSQPGLDVRTEFGSNDYYRGQLRYGTVTDNSRLDNFVSLSYIFTNGFRQNSKESIFRFSDNLGYRFSARSEGRLFLDYDVINTQRPGAITLAQLESDPFQAATGSLLTKAQIDFKPLAQIAYKHTFLLGKANVLSFYGQFLKVEFNNPTVFARYSGPEQKVGFGLRDEINTTLWRHKNRVVWGADVAHYWDTQNTNGPVYFGTYEAVSSTGVVQQAIDHSNLTQLYGQDFYNLSPRWIVVVGGQFSDSTRNLVATTPTPTYYFYPITAAKNYVGFNPKVGIIWAVRPKAQIFANVSRSFEPPDQYEFSPSYSSGSQTNLNNLDAQTGTTVEGGTRGGDSNFGWDLAAYYSWIDKEIFSVESPANSGNYFTFNRNHTRHSGIEAGTHGKVPASLAGGSINWNLAYTWNDYRFSNDPDYGNNQLPIVPPQFTRLDLTWRRSGFYVGPNVQAASSLFVDLTNTFKAPGYGVVGATMGYYREGKIRVFFDLRNLGNKYYAASTEYVTNAGHADTSAFDPGLTRAVFGGVEIRLP